MSAAKTALWLFDLAKDTFRSASLLRLSTIKGLISAVFVISPEQINRMQLSTSAGYAAHLGKPNAYAGFSVDTTGASMEKISGFLKSCEHQAGEFGNR